MDVYIEDGVILDFKDAVKGFGFQPSKHSLEEMVLICKALHEEDVSYSLAQAILSPEKIDLSELGRSTQTKETPNLERSSR